MEKNSTRMDNEKHSKVDLLNVYLKIGLPTQQVESILSQHVRDHKELDALVTSYRAQLGKVHKVASKFSEKVIQRYNHLDTPELLKKGIKFAAKHQLTDAEVEAFKRIVLKGDVNSQYLPFQELNYTEMARFLGFNSQHGQTITVRPPDHASLNEIARLYELSKQLHAAVRNNYVSYRSCAPDVITASFEKDKHNINLFIHPLLIALFMPKVDILERRMLLSNIGRLVIQRTQMYFQSQPSSSKQLSKFANWNFNLNDLLPGELQADLEMAFDIARDPNSLNYFNDESPMSNLLKRFTIQIELWKNILDLRRGHLYSKSDSFNAEDNIMGLQRILTSYDWAYFDSPDLASVQDEGTMLRKLLAAFSLRPTYTQISSFVHRTGLGASNFGAVARSQFINTPICNIKLPINIYGGGQAQPVSLRNSLTQSDWFVENKMVVPKNKAVIHSEKVIFFYVNRRHQSVNFANVDVGFHYVYTPTQYNNITNINTTELAFTHDMDIGNKKFLLQSVVVLNPLFEGQLATGCSSIVCCHPDQPGGRHRTTYFYYNPLGAGVLFERNGQFVRNDPITQMHEHSADPRTPGFIETARKYGTIFMYVNTD